MKVPWGKIHLQRQHRRRIEPSPVLDERKHQQLQRGQVRAVLEANDDIVRFGLLK